MITIRNEKSVILNSVSKDNEIIKATIITIK